jgi:hypothetical protein
MLLSSIPNVSTAIYLSSFNAALEMTTRAWVFVSHISTGGKKLVGLEGDNDNSTLHRAYVRRARHSSVIPTLDPDTQPPNCPLDF